MTSQKLQSILLLLQDSIDHNWIAIIAASSTALTAAIGGGYAVYKAIIRVRKSKEIEEKAIQKRIDDAVKVAKSELTHMLEMSQSTTNHWRDMAGVFEKEKDHEREVHSSRATQLEAELIRLREDRDISLKNLAIAKTKIEEIVDLNLSLQGQITTNAKNLELATQATQALQREVSTLQKKVTKIDERP